MSFYVACVKQPLCCVSTDDADAEGSWWRVQWIVTEKPRIAGRVHIQLGDAASPLQEWWNVARWVFFQCCHFGAIVYLIFVVMTSNIPIYKFIPTWKAWI